MKCVRCQQEFQTGDQTVRVATYSDHPKYDGQWAHLACPPEDDAVYRCAFIHEATSYRCIRNAGHEHGSRSHADHFNQWEGAWRGQDGERVLQQVAPIAPLGPLLGPHELCQCGHERSDHHLSVYACVDGAKGCACTGFRPQRKDCTTCDGVGCGSCDESYARWALNDEGRRPNTEAPATTNRPESEPVDPQGSTADGE